VGRLEVGTETLVDKSKSVKTVLMDLFLGNPDIEGATVVNACYGGTAALLNAVAWCSTDDACINDSTVVDDADEGNSSIYSAAAEHRPRFKYAIVVAADIAVYARGAARPTGGAGAVAMLIGRDAPLAIRLRDKATHATNVYDFYKPDPTTEYPTVDGAHSQTCYYQAIQDVYQRFCTRFERHHGIAMSATAIDYFCFHAPYNKLVQKSYARLFFMDARRDHERYVHKHHEQIRHDESNSNNEEEEKKESSTMTDAMAHPLSPWLTMPIDETYNDRSLDETLKKLSSKDFKDRLCDANYASQHIGNTYTASVFFGLLSLLDRRGRENSTSGTPTPLIQAGQSIVMFSYGSGALATMYRIAV
jgi:hydroxymethylglutaryl-CoA synthase